VMEVAVAVAGVWALDVQAWEADGVLETPDALSGHEHITGDECAPTGQRKGDGWAPHGRAAWNECSTPKGGWAGMETMVLHLVLKSHMANGIPYSTEGKWVTQYTGQGRRVVAGAKSRDHV
jgi:hypothetical protein